MRIRFVLLIFVRTVLQPGRWKGPNGRSTSAPAGAEQVDAPAAAREMPMNCRLYQSMWNPDS